MNEPFVIPVIYNGAEQEYKARLERWGYTHRIAVLIGETTITFEPDEDGGYRALNVVDPTSHFSVDQELLRLIAEKLVKLIAD
jgi:hypothetical protein